MPPKPERRIVKLRESLRSSSFKVEVKGYFENSSIHGMRYIIEKHRPNFERLLWLVTLCACLLMAGYYTKKVWDTTPILSQQMPDRLNHEVPLPAVTICSNAKVSTKSNWGQDMTIKDLHTLRHICGEAFPNSRAISVRRLNETAALFDSTCTLDIVKKDGNLSQHNCKNMFQKIITEQGACFTFNAYHPKHIYRDDVYLGEVPAGEFGYSDPHFGATDGRQVPCGDWAESIPLLEPVPGLASHLDPVPGVASHLDPVPGVVSHLDPVPGVASHLKAAPGVASHLKCGNHTLKLSLYSSRDDSGYCTFSNKTGFKVIIHNPKEVPIAGVRRLIWTKEEDNERHSIDVETETKITVKVEARIRSHSPDLLWFSPEKRGCYAEGEKYLRFFKSYTKENCQLECLANKTKELCNCADFFMPHTIDTDVCKRVHLPCIFDVIDLFRKKSSDYCNCYPSCHRLEYIPQVRVIKDVINKEHSWNDTSLTVNVEKKVTETMDYPSFTDVEVISAGGGVFGFFCGLSVISVIELFYYFLIRSFGNYYKDCKRRLS